ncbi:zinc finger protein 681-like isoform X2 [Dendronephthya gigantea]|nr:zinc finger protein 681-like isoform X2 [Dendronephthya gigantea]
MKSEEYDTEYTSIQEAPEIEDKPVRRTYPAFIEDKTFLPTFSLSTKAQVLDDEEEDYSEFTLADQLNDSPSFASDVLDESERWHVCHKCNKVFGTAKELRRHLPRHKISKKVYECEICYRTFTQSNHLKQHMPVHSGEKPFKCPQCDMTFTRSSSLTRHQIIHSGSKPYQCKICSKGFNRNGNLKDHMFTHAQHKPYKCKICAREFVQSNKFKSHVQMHAGTSLEEWAMFNVNITDESLRESP